MALKEVMSDKNIRQRLLMTVLCAFLAMNFPLLLIASKEKLLFGFPVLYIYLFSIWFLTIIAVRYLVIRLASGSDKNKTRRQDNA